MAGEMTCTASDGKGNCTAATGPDGTTLVVVAEAAQAGGSLEIDGVRVRATAPVFLAARAARLTVATTGGRLHPRRSTRRDRGAGGVTHPGRRAHLPRVCRGMTARACPGTST